MTEENNQSGKGKISRREFLSGVASTAASTYLPVSGAAVLGAGAATASAAQYSRVGTSRESATPAPHMVENNGYRLMIDSNRGSIVSFRSSYGEGRELLIPDHASLPLFKIELMDDRFNFRTVDALKAGSFKLSSEDNQDGRILTLEFIRLADLPLHARVSLRCPRNEALTYWSLEIDNQTAQWIGHVQFPVLEIPFDNPQDGDPGSLLWSEQDGQLASPIRPAMTIDRWGAHPQNTPEAWRTNNYPGQWVSTQLMAYYNRAGGLYLACDDATGLPKYIGPLMEDDGVTLGLGHYPGTRGPGKTELPYHVVLGAFQGDWYTAAEIYRKWSSKQAFCGKKISERSDIPKWLPKSPVAIAFPMRGQGDWDGPAKENPEYAPATHALPYLDKLAEEFDSPLIPIVFNWEHGGPWVQPDAFPPVGDTAAMQEFMTKARDKGWHPMVYGDGLCWVTWQKNTNYDGMPYFRAHNGERAVARRWDGTLFEDILGAWRKNYLICVGTESGREALLGMTRGMANFHPEIIQQFDQGPGPRACYASDHGHPPVPGPWMAENFHGLLESDRQAAVAGGAAGVMSCEGAPPEIGLQKFQIWDAREGNCPLYSFLYHEYANGFQGFYTNRVSDESLRASLARAIVQGYMLILTLRDKGRIAYDWDQTWSRAVPDQDAIADWTKRLNQFRAGVARDYLIYGRMLPPWPVTGVTERDMGRGKEPLVPSATWQAQDGRKALVLVNFSDLGETPRVELQGEGKKNVKLNLDGNVTERSMELPAALDLEMEPRSIGLIELT